MTNLEEVILEQIFSLKVYKEYFNFASAHFMLFEDGTREPIHGHNYRVKVAGKSKSLKNDMVLDFLDIKPVVRKICDSLDHKVLIPKQSPLIEIYEKDDNNYEMRTQDGSFFSFPKSDCLLLPILNSSVERIAEYLAMLIKEEVYKQFNFTFETLEVEVEETIGQSATILIKEEL